MLKSLPFTIGLRYTGAKRRNNFISIISGISMTGLALGVAVMILVLSVFNGFERELRDRILGMIPHGSIYGADAIEDWEPIAEKVVQHPNIVGAAPFVNVQGMMSNRGRVQGVMVNGVSPDWERKVSILPDFMKSGEFDSLQAGKYNVILGELLAKQLGAKIGDKVTLIMPEASLTPAGVMPRLKRFTVTGTFAVGAELDVSFAYVHMADAAKLARIPGRVQGLRLQTDDLFKAPSVVWNLMYDLEGHFRGSDWTRTHGNLFQAIKMEKFLVGLLMIAVVLVAAFNIVSTLVMLVTDKQGDIAILRTLGMSPRSIMAVFMVQGSIIGCIGVISGTLLGLVLALNFSEIIAGIENLLNMKFLDAKVYFISYVPSEVRVGDVVVVFSGALLLSILATIYPAIRAARVQPAEALRYDI